MPYRILKPAARALLIKIRSAEMLPSSFTISAFSITASICCIKRAWIAGENKLAAAKMT